MSAKKSASKRAPQKAAPSSRNLWIALAAVAVIAVLAVVVLSNKPSSAAGLPAEISVAEAAAKRSAGAFILDVREPSEWNESHLAGATLIPLGDLAARVNEVPRDKEVVVVCRSGNRSQQGRDILKSAGFTNVTSMAGGLNQWKAAGLDTVTGP